MVDFVHMGPVKCFLIGRFKANIGSFATTVYGRPFGINDGDCDVSMPESFNEQVRTSTTDTWERVCFSDYQVQLNRCYQAASPMLSRAFGGTGAGQIQNERELRDLANKINDDLDTWKASLTPELTFETLLPPSEGEHPAKRFHRLQSLALELTYHNLVIIVHRAVLVGHRWTEIYENTPEASRCISEDGPALYAGVISHASFDKLFKSAIAISKIGERSAVLQAASRTHLCAFMGLSIFSASVVVAMCALTRPLSDMAQQAKRCIVKMLVMQRQLSTYSALNAQCSSIIERLVHLITRQETTTMLQEHDNAGTQQPGYTSELNKSSNEPKNDDIDVPWPQSYTDGLYPSSVADPNWMSWNFGQWELCESPSCLYQIASVLIYEQLQMMYSIKRVRSSPVSTPSRIYARILNGFPRSLRI